MNNKTNKDRYKEAFSSLRISESFSLEVNQMTNLSKKTRLSRFVASVAILAIIIGGGSFAYATDFLGIQRNIQLWIYGEPESVTINFDGNGNYSMDYVDKKGEKHTRSGGGVAMNDDGSERPLTEDELMQELTSPEVEYEDDGRVWVYWFDQKVEITDKFEKDLCRVKLVNSNGQTIYMTIRYKDGYTTSKQGW